MTPEAKETFQNEVNALEESIKEFEKNWSEKQSKRRKEYLQEREQKNEIITAVEGTEDEILPSSSTGSEVSNTTTIMPAQDWIRTTSGSATVSGSAKR
jgi:exonuclease VII small subunit